MTAPFTMQDVRELAIKFCTHPAVDKALMRGYSPPLGYAHEIGHLLLSTSEDRVQPWYGFDEPGTNDYYPEDEAKAMEIAASVVHCWIVTATVDHRTQPRLRAKLRLSVGIGMEARDMFDWPDWWTDPKCREAARRLILSTGLRKADVLTRADLERTILRTLSTT